jgi:putative transposase
METLAAIGPRLGVARTCAAFDLPTATYYRRRCPTPAPSVPRPSPARTLPAAERAAVLAVLHEPRFVDRAPAAVQAQLLDEDRYLCSERTMYRILAANREVRERRVHSSCARYSSAPSSHRWALLNERAAATDLPV